jgi:hypothetical protein
LSGRLTVSYAGYVGESDLLESLYQKAMAGERVGTDLYRNGSMLAYWTHELRAPWQTETWLEQMREASRPNAFARLFLNQWVTASSSFVSLEDWDACTCGDLRPVLFAPELPAWVGVDASVRHDQTAIVATTFDAPANRVRLMNHVVFRPSPEQPLDFEGTIVATLEQWMQAYSVRRILADPFQMESVIQRLQKRGWPIEGYAQSVPNLTEAASNLFQLVRSRTLQVYPDQEMRRSVLATVASESARGWKLAKEKQSRKIDAVVALSMACLGAVRRMGFAPLLAATFGSDPAEALSELFSVRYPRNPAGLPEFDIGFTDRFGNPLRSVVK